MSLEREILKELAPTVDSYLKNPTWDNRAWNPGKIMNFMESDDRERQLALFREHANSVTDPALVIATGFAVTERGLPNYSARAGHLVGDGTGVSKDPWSRFFRRWNAEEEEHGAILYRYLFLSGRIDMEAFDYSAFHLIENGWVQNPDDIYHALFYPMVQEQIAQIGYIKLARLVADKDPLLAGICKKIAGDESRHAAFYKTIGKALFSSRRRDEALIHFDSFMDKVLNMPSRLMDDRIEGEPPTLYEKFTNVSISSGVFAGPDYADILEGLNKDLGVIDFATKDEELERIKKRLIELPNRFRKVAKRRAEHTPVPFDWIYGRVA